MPCFLKVREQQREWRENKTMLGEHSLPQTCVDLDLVLMLGLPPRDLLSRERRVLISVGRCTRHEESRGRCRSDSLHSNTGQSTGLSSVAITEMREVDQMLRYKFESLCIDLKQVHAK